jgi:hypothetical protein
MTVPAYSAAGSSYTNFPRAMLAGSYNGMFELVYPQPSAFTLAGQPAGAFGLPTAVLRSRKMPAAGMATWLGFFTGATDLAVQFYMDVWNPYTAALSRVTGTLLRPRWVRVQAARSGALVNYENVEITLINAVIVPPA